MLILDDRNEYPECVVCGVKRRNEYSFYQNLPSISDALIIQDELGIDLSKFVEPEPVFNQGWEKDEWIQMRTIFLANNYCSLKCFNKHLEMAKKKAKERIYSHANRSHPSQEEYPQDKLRQILIEEEGCCRVCGDDRVLELHHIIPQEYGGKTTRGNCVLLCPTCHALTRGQGIIG